MTITPIIGLEVHVELKTKSKMFCGCDADHFHVDPNTHTCPVCLALPGALPVPNQAAVDMCLKLGLALGCTVQSTSFFERKNYFYPDLPKGYQISQYQKPFTINGSITISGHKIRINRAHLEEDTAKSVHLNGETLIDYNRSGVPLVEVVSEPDIPSPEVAKEYLLKIQQIIRYLGISDADIEKGSMRCEPTVNLKIDDNKQTFYTPLAEIKNIASLTGVQTAIQYEIDRQAKQFAEDHVVKSSSSSKGSSVGGKTTRGWDADKSVTFLQREKEGSSDYRYFPEPDIPPFEFTEDYIENIRATLPELPDAKIAKYKSLSLSDYDAKLLADDSVFSSIFEKVLNGSTDPEFVKFVTNLLIGPLKTIDLDIQKINPGFFKNIFDHKSELSSSAIKQIILASYQTGTDPLVLAKEQNLFQVSDTGAIKEFAKKILADNPKAVEDYKKNPNSIGFLIGQLMKASAGSANPQIAKEIMIKLLE